MADGDSDTVCNEPLPAEGRSRKHAILAGGAVFAGCVAGAVILTGLLPSVFRVPRTIEIVLAALYIAVPPSLALGAVVGYDVYRLATRRRLHKETRWYIWVIALFCAGWIVIPIFVCHYRRKRIFQDALRPGHGACVCYVVIILLIAAIVWIIAASEWLAVPIGMGYGTLAALFLADCLVVNVVAKWLHAQRLYPPPSKRLQFSLGTLMGVVLAAGAWVSGLVLIYREWAVR